MSKIALPAIRTVGNYHLFPKQYEVTTQPSETIPDQSMTVSEIVSRFAKGLPVNGNANPPIYEGENPILPANFKTLDMVEQRQIISDLKKKVNQTQKDLAIKQRDAAIAKQKADFEAAVNERVKAQQKQSTE